MDYLGHFRCCEKSYALPCGSRRGYSPWSLGDWPAATFQAKLPGCIGVHLGAMGSHHLAGAAALFPWEQRVAMVSTRFPWETVFGLGARKGPGQPSRGDCLRCCFGPPLAELEALCALGCDAVMSAVGLRVNPLCVH